MPKGKYTTKKSPLAAAKARRKLRAKAKKK